VLVDIINCFWANRTTLLDGKVLGIVISFKDLGSAPIRLYPPTREQPTILLSKPNRVTPNPIFLDEDTLNYLDNLHVSTTLSSTDSTSSESETSSTPSTLGFERVLSTDSLPHVIEFTNLDQTKDLKAAKKTLKGVAGVLPMLLLIILLVRCTLEVLLI